MKNLWTQLMAALIASIDKTFCPLINCGVIPELETQQVGAMYYVFEDGNGKRIATGTKSCIDPCGDASFMDTCFLYKDAIRRGVDIKDDSLIGLFRGESDVGAVDKSASRNLTDHGEL